MKGRSKATQRYLDELAQRKATPKTKSRTKTKRAPAATEVHTQFSAEDIRKMKAVLEDDVKASTIDPDVLQVIMAAVREMAIELRKPSPEEEAKKREENERRKAERIRAAEDGERNKAILDAEQFSCTHSKPNGEHTFRGQVHSDGWAMIRCIRCRVSFRVRPLPQQVQQGLNLDQIRGLTIEHLRKWQEQSPLIDQRIAESHSAMTQMSKDLAEAQLRL